MSNILSLNKKISLLFLIFVIFFFGNSAIRIVLWMSSFSEVSLLDVPEIMLLGLFHDLVEWFYFGIPLTLFFLLLPANWVRKKITFYLYFLFGLFTVLFTIFLGVSEWLFWAEFGKRFNFIAVDYLPYTKEVIGTIEESFNMPMIYLGVGLFTTIIAIPLYLFLKRKWEQYRFIDSFAFWPIGILYFVIPICLFNLNITFTTNSFNNAYSNQLAGNGLYHLFNAYWSNELNYNDFYPTIEKKQALDILQREMSKQNPYVDDDVIKRNIDPSEAEKKYNVFFITVESLSSSYLQAFGGKQGLTPNLDKLVTESLLFTRFFASGTRTVRGLEALNLSLPPTPGDSIVKRPDNNDLFNLGYIFKQFNYDVRYIYAGHSYFDNMDHFFSSNGYTVVDRAAFEKSEIAYANIWGIDDNSMFKKSLKLADDSYQMNKPFFNFILTISNHRPYTYPDGLIDIPSHFGREGGVKFSDYAIGEFFKVAKTKPWFKNTIFVIVADHSHSSAGKSYIPVQKYHIPLIFYAPGIIEAQKVNTIGGQIDVAPTLLGMMNFKYTSQFMGRDLIKDPEGHVALLGTFKNLGMLDGDNLVIMSPQGIIEYFKVDMSTTRFRQKRVTPNKSLLDKASAYYQYASRLWHSQKMKVK